MPKKKVLVLGASGMLGRMVTLIMAEDKDLEVSATTRWDKKLNLPNIQDKVLSIGGGEASALNHLTADADYIVNCIGITKPYLKNETTDEIRNAVQCNILFPHLLAEKAKANDAVVLQIATDCVYSGNKGWYDESQPHDALDAYGKSKSMGEVNAEGFHNIRCSIIGPEPERSSFLMSWILGQEKGAEVNGFTNHQWNGVTTHAFAKLCRGVIKKDIPLGNMQHAVPSGSVSKRRLLEVILKAYGRDDVKVNPVEAGGFCDRTLLTKDEHMNIDMWSAAGYKEIPTVEDMVNDMAQWEKENWV